MPKTYLKLGSQALSFYDPGSQLNIRGHEVIALDRLPKSKRVSQALRGGHICTATEEEYAEYQDAKAGGVAPKKEVVKAEKSADTETEAPELTEVQKILKATLEELGSKKNILGYFEKGGWTEEDIETLKALPNNTPLADVISKAIQLDSEYTN